MQRQPRRLLLMEKMIETIAWKDNRDDCLLFLFPLFIQMDPKNVFSLADFKKQLQDLHKKSKPSG